MSQAETQFKEHIFKIFKKTIDESNSPQANTFKNHLYALAKQDSANTLHQRLQVINKDRPPLSFDEMDRHLILGIMVEKINRRLKAASKDYSEHKQLFKQAFHGEGKNYFRPLETTNLEELQDGLTRIIHNNKVKKYAHSFLRSYKNLMNEESYEIFSNIMENDYDREHIQKEIRKIASFKDSDDLNRVLIKIMQQEHSPEYIINKIEQQQLNANIIKQEGNKLAIQINDFEASSILGSSQWCISTDESYFNEYLLSVSAENLYPEEEHEIEESNLEGKQIFYYDFDKEPSDPLYMIGFTISANGTITAAHDKNDISVKTSLKEGEIISIEEINEIISKIPYSKKEIIDSLFKSNNLSDAPTIYETPNFLLADTRNALNVFVEINKQYLAEHKNELFLQAESVIFPSELINKSFEDFFNFKDISSKEMVEDCLYLYNLLEKIEDYRKGIEESHTEDEDMDFEEEYFEFDEDDKMIFDVAVNGSDFFKNKNVKAVFNNLNDLEITIIFKENEEQITNVIKAILSSDNNGNHSLDRNNHKIYNYHHTPLSVFSSYVLGKEDDSLTDKEQAILSFQHCYKNNESKSFIEEKMITFIDNDIIHTNKILGNGVDFSSTLKEKFMDYLNKNPHKIEMIDNNIIQNIANDNYFIDNMNSNVCQALNKGIKDNYLNFGKLGGNHIDNIFNKSSLSFGEQMKKLKDKNIIDDEIIRRFYDSSVVSFGNRKDEKLFLPKINKAKVKP